MKHIQNNTLTNNMLVSLKDERWLSLQRIAGKIASDTLIALEREVKQKTTKSLSDLNAYAGEIITKAGGIPTFKGYGKTSNPFPDNLCISINKQLVHGVCTNYCLQEGDLVSFDLGVTVEGAIADTATTCICGEPKSEQHQKLVLATKEALNRAIQSIQVGKRLGCIGETIYKYAKSQGFSVIDTYGGHGISWNKPHDLPFVSNKADKNEGIRLTAGMTIAIEPLLVIGSSTKTRVLDDHWTVVCDDICSHEEHSIYIHEDRVEVITDRARN